MKTKKRIVLWLLVLAWMGLIFFFSAQNADDSSDTSGRFIRQLLAVFYPGFDRLDEAARIALIESLTFIVRKGAHFSIFAVLGILASAAFGVDFSVGQAFLCALPLCAFYALTDEVHQFFVSGRACQIRDMLIDTAGAALGCGVIALIRSWAAFMDKRRPKHRT